MQILDSVERLPKSGRSATAAAALPLIILAALGPGPPPGFLEAEGMPPVPDKTRTGRSFGRRVMDFQNWTLASNARWRLTDEQLAMLWQAEFPNSRSRYTIKERSPRAEPLQLRQAQQRPATVAGCRVRSCRQSGRVHPAVLLRQRHGGPGFVLQLDGASASGADPANAEIPENHRGRRPVIHVVLARAVASAFRCGSRRHRITAFVANGIP